MNAKERKWKDAPMSVVAQEVTREMNARLEQEPNMSTWAVNKLLLRLLNSYISKESLRRKGVRAEFLGENIWKGVTPNITLEVSLLQGHPSRLTNARRVTSSWQLFKVQRVVKDGRRTFKSIRPDGEWGRNDRSIFEVALSMGGSCARRYDDLRNRAHQLAAVVTKVGATEFLAAMSNYNELQRCNMALYGDQFFQTLVSVDDNDQRRAAILKAVAEGKRELPAGLKLTSTFVCRNDSQWESRSGSTVFVLRPLTEVEADIEDVGPMYRIRFEDGVETDAFLDELPELRELLEEVQDV